MNKIDKWYSEMTDEEREEFWGEMDSLPKDGVNAQDLVDSWYRKPQWISERRKSQFWSKVNDTGSCWEWTGSKSKHGYGKFKLGDKTIQSHRLAYQIIHNIQDLKDQVLHTCDNPCCVNPDHLFIGTHADNMMDKKRKGRSRNIGRTSDYIGVGWRKDVGKWRAYYLKDGKSVYIGIFNDEVEAAKAHDSKCIEHGILCDLNFQ